MTTTLEVTLGSHSSRGAKEVNEDCVGTLVAKGSALHEKGVVVAIADGVSSCDDGKKASNYCIAGFVNDYYSTPDSWSVQNAGQKVLSATNTWLYNQGMVNSSENKRLVSTLSTLVLKSTTAHIFHIGDSRIYRLRKSSLEQMTHDHRIWVSKDTNYLSRAMGVEPHLEVDYKSCPLQLGDVFLLTTDGIHDFVDDKTIKTIIAASDDLDTIAKALLAKALQLGSDDNLSCQLVKITNLPFAEEDEIMRRHANLPFPPNLSAGMILDGYKIIDELHASNRTQIYHALDTQTGEQCILKTPSINYEDDQQYRISFLHEEWAGKRVQHQNVLKVLDISRPKTCIYYVTEYISGETLRDWMHHNKKPYIREIREIIKKIANGLGALHRMEMIHQDLKPENIMVGVDGRVKIIDFGSVKIGGISDLSALEKMDVDDILGTLNYCAPEYHFGQRGSIQSDLYSLAVITYEMINGRLPFNKEMPAKPSKTNLAKMHYIPSMQINPMVPIWIDGALKKGCNFNPQARYQTIAEFIGDISVPNSSFTKSAKFIPLLEKNPLVFWKTLCAVMGGINIALLYLYWLDIF